MKRQVEYTTLRSSSCVFFVLAACKLTGDVFLFKIDGGGARITVIDSCDKQPSLMMFRPFKWALLHPWVRASVRAVMTAEDTEGAARYLESKVWPEHVRKWQGLAPIAGCIHRA
jgi:hypothetical protein